MKRELQAALGLVVEMIIAPSSVFEQIRGGALYKEVCLVFGAGALMTLLRSFSVHREEVGAPPIDPVLYQILTFLNTPLVLSITWYLCYVLFLCCVCLTLRLLARRAAFKPLAICLMAISALGVVWQIPFYFLTPLVSKRAALISAWLIYAWMMALSCLAVRISQGVSYAKAVPSFMIPWVVWFTVGAATVAPYLLWLNAR